MAKRQLAADCKVVKDLVKASLTSDGLTGDGSTFTGWEKCLAIVASNTPSTSVATLTVKIQKATLYDVSSDNASTDWSDIATDCMIEAATYATSSVGYLGAIDITIPSSDASGCLRSSVLTPGEGLTIDGLSVVFLYYNGSDKRPCSDWTPQYWPV